MDTTFSDRKFRNQSWRLYDVKTEYSFTTEVLDADALAGLERIKVLKF